MAFLQVDFFSETFGMSMNMNVILPQEIQVPNPVNGGRFPKPYPVMYLLHGWNWCGIKKVDSLFSRIS